VTLAGVEGPGAENDAAESGLDAEDIEQALTRLAELDPRATRVVELRFFGGLSEIEIAEVLGVTERTVRNDWRMARAWLRVELGEDE
jgi:RNA polymerase sigma factor (sigma-70 family)